MHKNSTKFITDATSASSPHFVALTASSLISFHTLELSLPRALKKLRDSPAASHRASSLNSSIRSIFFTFRLFRQAFNSAWSRSEEHRRKLSHFFRSTWAPSSRISLRLKLTFVMVWWTSRLAAIAWLNGR